MSGGCKHGHCAICGENAGAEMEMVCSALTAETGNLHREIERGDRLAIELSDARAALRAIVATDTHGKNVPDKHGAMRPTGNDFCGRCNRNSYWPHADDCPIALAIALLGSRE